MIIFDERNGKRRLLRVMHFLSRRRRLDFLELGKRTQARRVDFTGAAAGSGEECESGSGEGGKDTDHED